MSAGFKSRITRNLEKQSKKQTIMFAIGILLMLYLTFQYGIPLLGELGNLVFYVKELTSPKPLPSSQTQEDFMEPPLLSPPPHATNSAYLPITGRSLADGAVQIYLNNNLAEEFLVAKSESFTSPPLVLKEGENIIKARFKSKPGNTSEFTDEYATLFIKEPPKLEIHYPGDNSVFSAENQEISIQGTTNPNNKVRINEFLAIVDHEGNFSYVIRLNGGENNITIEAQDSAGNTTIKTLKLTYQP